MNGQAAANERDIDSNASSRPESLSSAVIEALDESMSRIRNLGFQWIFLLACLSGVVWAMFVSGWRLPLVVFTPILAGASWIVARRWRYYFSVPRQASIPINATHTSELEIGRGAYPGTKSRTPVQRDQEFVSLAPYWLESDHGLELSIFVATIDDVVSELRKTFSFVFGSDIAGNVELQQLDVAAAEVGIWQKDDSALWRLCLRLRRDIMSEGGTPVSGHMLAAYSADLNLLIEKLTKRETSQELVQDR